MHAGARSIVLIGMMGAGKSSVGRCLQTHTGLQCFDMDELIVAQSGLSIAEMFAQKGEQWFRNLETSVLTELRLNEPAIVVTGGGVVLRPGNVDTLKRLGTVIWLEADAETLLERASRRGNRPLLQTENPAVTLSEMLEARRPLYAAAADIRVDTTRRNHDDVADVILSEVEKRQAAGAS